MKNWEILKNVIVVKKWSELYKTVQNDAQTWKKILFCHFSFLAEDFFVVWHQKQRCICIESRLLSEIALNSLQMWNCFHTLIGTAFAIWAGKAEI